MSAKIRHNVSFNSMPNFRIVGGLVTSPTSVNITPCLYRSSRPDFLSENELSEFHQLGIRTVLDFRSPREYKKANGDHLLDHTYSVFKIKSPLGKYKPGDHVMCTPLSLPPPKFPISDDTRNAAPPKAKHYLVDFFKINYIWAVYNRAPWWFKLFSIFYLMIDLIKGTNFKHFVGAFAKQVLNKAGLAGQYKDMLNHSQGAIGASLKILSNPDNIPAMINCAHGKDRTGIVSALVLGCLGRSKEEIAKDYATSAEELERMGDRLHEEIVAKFDMCPSFKTAKYETMMEVLEYIDKTWGSISNYLESIGFTAAEQQKLRTTVLAEQ